MDIAFEEKIRLRAYELWIDDGMGEGNAEHHWLHAEKVVRNETETPTAAAPIEPKLAKVAKPQTSAKLKASAKAKAATKAKPVKAAAKSRSAASETVKKAKAIKAASGEAAIV